jgi:hypothetical protein
MKNEFSIYSMKNEFSIYSINIIFSGEKGLWPSTTASVPAA